MEPHQETPMQWRRFSKKLNKWPALMDRGRKSERECGCDRATERSGEVVRGRWGEAK